MAGNAVNATRDFTAGVSTDKYNFKPGKHCLHSAPAGTLSLGPVTSRPRNGPVLLSSHVHTIHTVTIPSHIPTNAFHGVPNLLSICDIDETMAPMLACTPTVNRGGPVAGLGSLPSTVHPID